MIPGWRVHLYSPEALSILKSEFPLFTHKPGSARKMEACLSFSTWHLRTDGNGPFLFPALCFSIFPWTKEHPWPILSQFHLNRRPDTPQCIQLFYNQFPLLQASPFRESETILQIVLAAFLQVGAKWPASEDKNLEVNIKFHFWWMVDKHFVCYLSYATPRKTGLTNKSLGKEFQASQVLCVMHWGAHWIISLCRHA